MGRKRSIFDMANSILYLDGKLAQNSVEIHGIVYALDLLKILQFHRLLNPLIDGELSLRGQWTVCLLRKEYYEFKESKEVEKASRLESN